MTIEVSAKKLEDAIAQGLEQLGATLDKVNVEILEQGGFLRKAKVRLTLEEEPAPAQKASADNKQAGSEKPSPAVKVAEHEKKPASDKKQEKKLAAENKQATDAKPEKKQSDKSAAPAPAKKQEKKQTGDKKPADKPSEPEAPKRRTEEDAKAQAFAVEFVKGVVERMGFEGVTAEQKDETIELTAPAGDDSILIGRHGETLSALSFLAEMTARADKSHINVTVDCNGYRERRAASLTAMARRRADECANKRRKIKLEPMERVDRRTVHNALTGDDRVTTASEGKEPHRYVVILPAKK